MADSADKSRKPSKGVGNSTASAASGKPVKDDRDILEVLREVPDATVLAAVQMLKLFFGRDPAIGSALSRIDSPEEIASIRALLRQVLSMVIK